MGLGQYADRSFHCRMLGDCDGSGESQSRRRPFTFRAPYAAAAVSAPFVEPLLQQLAHAAYCLTKHGLIDRSFNRLKDYLRSRLRQIALYEIFTRGGLDVARRTVTGLPSSCFRCCRCTRGGNRARQASTPVHLERRLPTRCRCVAKPHHPNCDVSLARIQVVND
jgi:hypothetical protein